MNYILVAATLIAGQVLAIPGLTNLKIDDSVLDRILGEQDSRIAPTFQELWFNQTIDHNAGNSKAVNYQQRYFVNDLYYKPGGPALLFIGGEGELDGRWTIGSVLTKAAQQLNGVVYGLEHRYYGKSQPAKDWSTSNLKHLSSQQALADLAKFVKEVPLPGQNGGVKPKTKWIVAGGSYPGNLAAWARFKYPELISGAIASSAPVFAKEYFFEYDQQVQKSLLNNGNQQCLNYYLDIFKSIDATLKSNNVKAVNDLKAKFSCQGVDTKLFAYSIDIISGLVQYNNNNQASSVKSYCASIKSNGTITEKIDDFAASFNAQLNGQTCKQFVDLTPLKSTVIDNTQLARQWTYQCCTEFAYWQLAPPQPYTAARSRIPDVAYMNQIYCDDLFAKGLRPHIDYTNSYYRGKNLRISNIVFNNGELDPWTPLSILPNYPNSLASMPSYIIKGASHATDLGLPNSLDTPYITEAKNRNIELIKKWVNGN